MLNQKNSLQIKRERCWKFEDVALENVDDGVSVSWQQI